MILRNPCTLSVVMILSAIAAGCRHGPLANSRLHASASFRILEPANGSGKKGEAAIDVGQPREKIEPARPFLPLRNPGFPPAALRAHDSGALVTAHVRVGTDGTVKEVTPSLVGFTTPSPFAKEYWAEVEAAVRRWEFQPAEIQSIEYMPREGERVPKIVRRELIEAEFDVAFTFTATGEVVPVKR